MAPFAMEPFPTGGGAVILNQYCQFKDPKKTNAPSPTWWTRYRLKIASKTKIALSKPIRKKQRLRIFPREQLPAWINSAEKTLSPSIKTFASSLRKNLVQNQMSSLSKLPIKVPNKGMRTWSQATKESQGSHGVLQQPTRFSASKRGRSWRHSMEQWEVARSTSSWALFGTPLQKLRGVSIPKKQRARNKKLPITWRRLKKNSAESSRSQCALTRYLSKRIGRQLNNKIHTWAT